jgi:NTP pyrophosphatase (non-canonical NTP hydrolase)
MEESSRFSLRAMQAEHREWATRNFGTNRIWQDPFLGMVEELGELAHAKLKQKQGIRGTYEEHEEAAKDSVGDFMVYLSDFCNMQKPSWDLEMIITKTWDHVKQRDWVKDPQRGVVATEAVQRRGGGPKTD